MTDMSEEKMNCTIQHQIHQYLFPITYILVLLVGLPANAYSLYHAWLQLRARNELGVYLFNLTVSDLLYLVSLPFWLQYFFQVGAGLRGVVTNIFLCRLMITCKNK